MPILLHRLCVSSTIRTYNLWFVAKRFILLAYGNIWLSIPDSNWYQLIHSQLAYHQRNGSMCCPPWIRTTIDSFKGSRPAFRREDTGHGTFPVVNDCFSMVVPNKSGLTYFIPRACSHVKPQKTKKPHSIYEWGSKLF